MTNLYVLAGPLAGRVFELRDGANYIGRSPENDIRIDDRTISRRHLKITKSEDKYFVRDLESHNRTFFDRNYLEPGIDVEVKEGTPIAIGISVICIGEKCKDEVIRFIDFIELPRLKETGEPGGIHPDRRKQGGQKELEIFYKICDTLMANLPIRETLQKILDYILELLKRIERGGFILLDPKDGQIGEVIFKSRKPNSDSSLIEYRNILDRVIEAGRPLVVSDVQTEESVEIAETLELSKIQSMMCFPLIKESKVIGVVFVDSREIPYAFRKEDRSLFMDLCQRISMAIDYAWLASEFDTLKMTRTESGS